MSTPTPLEIAVIAARRAGEIQRARFATAISIRMKGAVDLVTEVDVACEAAVREVLGELMPGSAVLGEEGGATGSGEALWIVDPLDGTTNFAHAVPVFCVSIAYEFEGTMRAGVIYDALRDELFTAEAGGGAFLNGKKLAVTTREVLDTGLFATGFAYDYRVSKRHNFDAFAAMTRASQGVRRLGAAALDLAYVAAGRFDGFWEMGLKPWDTAAGMLLVREAGGRMSDLSGCEYKCRTPDVVASNGLVHGAMLEVLGRTIPPVE